MNDEPAIHSSRPRLIAAPGSINHYELLIHKKLQQITISRNKGIKASYAMTSVKPVSPKSANPLIQKLYARLFDFRITHA